MDVVVQIREVSLSSAAIEAVVWIVHTSGMVFQRPLHKSDLHKCNILLSAWWSTLLRVEVLSSRLNDCGSRFFSGDYFQFNGNLVDGFTQFLERWAVLWNMTASPTRRIVAFNTPITVLA